MSARRVRVRLAGLAATAGLAALAVAGGAVVTPLTPSASATPLLARSAGRAGSPWGALAPATRPRAASAGLAPWASDPTGAPVLRLTAGDTPLTVDRDVYYPDAEYASGGTTAAYSGTVRGTTQPQLFLRERTGLTAYHVPVPASGRYRVTLSESELQDTAARQRVFSVTAEGNAMANSLDLVASPGARAAKTISKDVTVTDGVLDLGFRASRGVPKADALTVTELGTAGNVVTPPNYQPSPGSYPPPPSDDQPLPGGLLSHAGIFGSGSFWNQTVPADAPVAATSPDLVANLANQASTYWGGAAFDVWQYDGTVYTVDSSVPLVNVHWDDCQHKGYTPRGITDQLSNVPFPADALTTTDTDRSVAIYSPSLDTAWEFWKTVKQPDGWHACWGGRLDHVSTNRGYFSGGFGASGSGLASALAGQVSIADMQRGYINHVVSLEIPNVSLWKSWSWPAQRSDGDIRTAGAILEGQRFRLDPAIDVAGLHLNPVATMIAKAAQTYGFVVTDRSSAVAVLAESGLPYQQATGTNPWNGYLGPLKSYNVFKGFPWDKLRALPVSYGQPAS